MPQSLYQRPAPARQHLEGVKQNIQATPNAPDRDDWLRQYAEARWGQQKVQIVEGRAFDRIKSPVMTRGIGKEQFVQSNLDGTWVGKGAYGNGQYHGVNAEKYVGFQYTSIRGGGHVYATKLSPTARVVDFQKMGEIIGRRFSSTSRKWSQDFYKDIGRSAADLGYDAIYVQDANYMVVLNQRALIVDRRSLPGGQFYGGAEARAANRLALQGESDALYKRAMDLARENNLAKAQEVYEEYEVLVKQLRKVPAANDEGLVRAAFENAYGK